MQDELFLQPFPGSINDPSDCFLKAGLGKEDNSSPANKLLLDNCAKKALSVCPCAG